MFNQLPVELRLSIWEEYFLEHFGCRPRAHYLVGYGDVACQWPFCRKQFTEQTLMTHYRAKHEPRRAYYDCPLCPPHLPKRCSTLRNLKFHVGRHFARGDGTKEQQRVAHGLCNGTIGPATWEWDPASRLWPETRLLINHEALEVARLVLRTHFQPVADLRAPVRALSKSHYHTLLSWPMDILYYDRDLTHPSLESLKLAPYAQNIQKMAIDLNLAPGDDISLVDKVYSLFATLTNLRKLYLVVGVPSNAPQLRLGEFHLHQHTLQQLQKVSPGEFPWCSLRDFRGLYGGLRDTVSVQKGSIFKGPATSMMPEDIGVAEGVLDLWLGLARDLGKLAQGAGRKGKLRVCWVSEMRVMEGNSPSE